MPLLSSPRTRKRRLARIKRNRAVDHSSEAKLLRDLMMYHDREIMKLDRDVHMSEYRFRWTAICVSIAVVAWTYWS